MHAEQGLLATTAVFKLHSLVNIELKSVHCIIYFWCPSQVVYLYRGQKQQCTLVSVARQGRQQ